MTIHGRTITTLLSGQRWGGKNKGERVSYRYLIKALKEIKDKAGIDKPVNPHHFRHSRATYLANKLTEAQLCEWFGWVQGSDVPAKYVHLSGRDIDADYKKLHGIEDKEETQEAKLSPTNCPRCGESNEPKAKFCLQCGQALKREAINEVEEAEDQIVEEAEKSDISTSTNILKMIKENDEIDIEELKPTIELLNTVKESEEMGLKEVQEML